MMVTAVQTGLFYGCSVGEVTWVQVGRNDMTSLNTIGQSAKNNSTNHGSQNKPRLIFWELTKGCNLRCIHCRASA
ncbi:MAG: hypothetical protein WA261_15780, partial [Candidatus Sulfotelmatobacter sp.]